MSKPPARPPEKLLEISPRPLFSEKEKILNEVKPPLISISVCKVPPAQNPVAQTRSKESPLPSFVPSPLTPPRKIKGMASLSCHSHERGRRVREERMLNCFSFAPRLIRRESRERVGGRPTSHFPDFFAPPANPPNPSEIAAHANERR